MRRLARKPVGTTALVVGVLAVLLALLADELGLGGHPGFNWKQGILLAAGVAVGLFGLAIVSGIGAQVVEEATDPVPDEPEGRAPGGPPLG